MSDEPFTDDQNLVWQSGVPVRLYSGGKLGAGSTPLPPTEEGDEGDVLTIVDGDPEWAPPGGGSGGAPSTVWEAQSPYWLIPNGKCFTSLQLPFPYELQTQLAGTVCGQLGMPTLSTDNYAYVDFASGTGTAVLGVLPSTTDGQTWITPRDGFDQTCNFVRIGTTGDVDCEGLYAWRIRLTLGASRTFTLRVIHGSSPATRANSYAVDAQQNASSTTWDIPSAINTTLSNTDFPTVVATLSSSTTWTLAIETFSFDT